MKKEASKVHIIGAGVSGLVAAQVLESQGYSPVIIEATARVGGRVKTDIVDGYQLDRGFQVLLTGYPAAKKYLDYESLDLQYLDPGAVVFKKGNQRIIGDPLRNISLLLPTIFSGIGTISDKLKVLKLKKKLKQLGVEDVFLKRETSTYSYLEYLGFSSQMITEFFQPFFSGIFLEKELATSSRMFEFIYKMFGEGYAAIPRSGIEAIPKQLLSNLKHTEIHYNSRVERLQGTDVILEDGSVLEGDAVILACEAKQVLMDEVPIPWKACDTLYFETGHRAIKGKMIGLLPHDNTLINNVFYHTSIETAHHPAKDLLSVTILDQKFKSTEDLISKAQDELKSRFGIDKTRFLKHYRIVQALPNLTDVKYAKKPDHTRLKSGVYLASDTQLNGSLNAAMLSGESAAEGVLRALA